MSRAGRKAWWGDFPSTAFRGLDAQAVVAVLPVAAIEQHGPHLPVSTDASIMEGMLDTAIGLLPEELDTRILPIQSVGKSNEHIRFPGTLTLAPATLIEAWTALGASISRTGVRKLVIVNSHGGNEEVMGIVARELRERFDMLAMKTSWQRFGRPENLFSEEEEKRGIHGGDVETSLMLHFRPDLVDMTKAENFPSAVSRAEAAFGLVKHTGTHAFAWLSGDLNPHGVVGEAAKASAEKGRLTALHQAKGFVRLIEEVRALKLGDYLR